MLTFDEPTHTYRWKGVVVPSVTQVLGGLYSFAGVPLEVLEAAKERGSDVHLACQLFDENDLRDESLTDEVRGYLKGWQKFTRDCAPVWSAIEKPVYHQGMRFAGTPDRMGRFFYQGLLIDPAQVDIKTSAASHPCWGVQTMAYNHAAGQLAARRFSVQLRPDGDYRLVEWKDPGDWPTFVSLMTLRNFKERHNL